MSTFKFRFPVTPKPDPDVEIEGVRTPVKFLKDKSVTIEQYKTVRADSAGWRALFPKLTDECLLHAMDHYVNNCERDDGITYDRAVVHQILPEVVKRWKEVKS